MASLRGPHHVDFQKINQTSNLFAITGKTGSGKSTLLNCISLALYGEVYKKGASATDFITSGEAAAEIELEFSTRNQVYIANWKLRLRKKNGEELKKPQLIRVLYKIVKDEKVATDESIEDITQLSFNQFCKTTILNQGEFSRFLTSNFTERKEILQKFYAGENLDLLSLHLKSKINQIESNINNRLNNIKGLQESFQDIDVSENQLKSLGIELDGYHQFQKGLTNVQSLFNDFHTTYDLNIKSNQRQEHVKVEIEAINKDHNYNLIELNKTKDSLHNQTELIKRRKPILRTAITNKVKLDEGLKKKLQLELDQKESTDKKNQYVQDKVNISTKIEDIKSHLDLHVAKFPAIIEFDSKQIQEDFLQLSNYYTNFKLYSSSSKNIQKQLDLKSTHISDLEKQLKSIKAVDVLETEQLELNKQQTELEARIDSTRNHLQQVKINSQQISELQQQTSLIKSRVKTESKSLELKQDLIKKRELDLEVLHGRQHQQELQIAISLCHDQSMQDHQCVVCGEELKQGHEIHKPENRQLDTSLAQELNISSEELIEARQLEQKAIFKIEQNELALQEVNTKTKLCFTQLKNVSKTLKLEAVMENEIDPDTLITRVEQLIEKHNSEFKLLNSRINQLQLDKENHSFLRIKRQQYLEEKKETQSQQTSFHNKLKIVSNDFLTITTRYQLSLDLNEDQSNFTPIKYTISEYIDLKGKLPLLIQKQDTIAVQLNKTVMDINKLCSQLKSTDQANQELISFLDTHTESRKPAQELDSLENTHNSLQSTVNKLSTKKQKLEVQLAELTSKSQNFREQYQSTHLKLKELSKGLDYEIGSLKFETIKTSPQQHELKHFLGKVKGLKIISIDFDALSITKTTFSELISNFKQIHKEKQNYLAGQTSLFKQKSDSLGKVESINAQLSKLYKVQNQQLELNQLIGKDEFRNYVLSIIEELLIEQTNRELRILCQGRYGLTHNNLKNRMSSEFKIIDYFNDASERKISTLSGGETFLVSLAMAMALAELTRGSAQIDSLFIDEGFGSLDSDSIQDVLDLLIEVQHSGKQIGIISHIKDLTARIPVNINVHKSDNGNSDIQIILN